MRSKIALVGKARVGKNHVADLLTKQYGFRQFAFADALKDFTRQLFPDEFKDGKKPRKLLQDFGAFCRSIDENVWIDLAIEQAQGYEDAFLFYSGILPEEPLCVFTDVRYPNEVARLREEGYLIVKVAADESVRLDRMKATGQTMTAEEMAHESEASIDELYFDVLLVNNGEDLTEQLRHIVESH